MIRHKVLYSFTLPEGMPLPFTEELTLIPADPKASDEEWLLQLRTEKVSALLAFAGRSLTADFIGNLPDSVKIIATASVGYEHIDLKAAKARGVVVTNTPDVLTNATADLGMMLLLNACRRGREYLEIMREGWSRPLGFNGMLGTDLEGKTLGIFGMGRIGRALADRARAFGLRIAYCNRHRLPPDQERGAAYYPTLREMLPHCQILSLNAPSTIETRNIVNRDAFSLLPFGSVLVNVGRGDLVDEEDLLEALSSGKIAAAGLDVFHNEPNFDRRFLEFPQVFLTPHVASATVETRSAMARRALENVARVVRGEPPLDPVHS